MRPRAPNAPIRLSRMMRSRSAGVRPPRASRQSASPSRWRPPVSSFQAVIISKAASSAGKTAAARRSTETTTTPSPSPTTGNHAAARPGGSEPASGQPGTGTIVR
jgi:hypothetical protein